MYERGLTFLTHLCIVHIHYWTEGNNSCNSQRICTQFWLYIVFSFKGKGSMFLFSFSALNLQSRIKATVNGSTFHNLTIIIIIWCLLFSPAIMHAKSLSLFLLNIWMLCIIGYLILICSFCAEPGDCEPSKDYILISLVTFKDFSPNNSPWSPVPFQLFLSFFPLSFFFPLFSLTWILISKPFLTLLLLFPIVAT